MARVPAGVFDYAKAREARKRLGYTRARLAAQIKVNADSIYDWENGSTRPSAKNMEKLAKALKLGLGELFSPARGTGSLRDLRETAGLTQDKLATNMNTALGLSLAASITRTRVSNWECARTYVPGEYFNAYAAVLGVGIDTLAEGVRQTLGTAHRPPPSWTPPVDKWEQGVKGVAAGNAELEFVYRMAAHAHALVATLAVTRPSDPDSPIRAADQDFRFELWRLAYDLIKDIRERTAAVRAGALGKDGDLADRTRSVLYTLDQYFTVVEDALGLPREKLPLLVDRGELELAYAQDEYAKGVVSEVPDRGKHDGGEACGSDSTR